MFAVRNVLFIKYAVSKRTTYARTNLHNENCTTIKCFARYTVLLTTSKSLYSYGVTYVEQIYRLFTHR